MRRAFLAVALSLLLGCPASDPPVSVNRGAGIEAVSSVTVLTIQLEGGSQDITPGTMVQRGLVKWLKANPEAKIQHMSVVVNNGWPQEIVLVVEGKTGS